MPTIATTSRVEGGDNAIPACRKNDVLVDTYRSYNPPRTAVDFVGIRTEMRLPARGARCDVERDDVAISSSRVHNAAADNRRRRDGTIGAIRPLNPEVYVVLRAAARVEARIVLIVAIRWPRSGGHDQSG